MKMKSMQKKQVIKEYVEQVKKPIEVVTPKFLSTGSTLLNLAMTNDINGGWLLGTFNNLVGDSNTGKTLMALTSFAEANKNVFFDKYRFVYDEPEQKNMFDLNLFKLVERLDASIVSRTIQEWQANCWKLIQSGKKFVYFLDTFDMIGSEEERERFDEMVKQLDKGKDVASQGSFKTEKARGSGEILREVKFGLKETDSLIIVISQTRDRIGATFGEKKIRAGGHALKFNSTHEPWARVISPIKEKDRVIGYNIEVKLKKNHYNGNERIVRFPIYGSYGIDDIGSMIDWMIEEGFWKKEKGDKGKIDTRGDILAEGYFVPRSELIDYIELNSPPFESDVIEGGGVLEKFRKIVGECWMEIEDEIKVKRKPRYY